MAMNPEAQAPREKAARKSLHHEIRYTISNDAMITLTAAGEILPGKGSLNREWIANNVEPIVCPSGRRIYRWGDIVATLKEVA